jgi:hypothetical protein
VAPQSVPEANKEILFPLSFLLEDTLIKYAIFASLMIFSVYASAHDGAHNTASTPEPEQYNYSEHLDIAKVIDITTIEDTQNACGPVDAHMVYVDHNGKTHDLQYKILGSACQNG